MKNIHTKSHLLVQSETRLRALLEASLDAIYFLKPRYSLAGEIEDFVIEDVNHRAEEELTMERTELIGKGICELFPINREKGYFDLYKQAFLEQKTLEREYSIEPEYQASGYYTHRVVPMPDAIAIYNRNITEQKRREQELEKTQERIALSEQRFRSIIEQANDLVFTLASDGCITYISPNITERLGYSVEEVLGKDITPFVHPEDLAENQWALRQVLEEKKVLSSVLYRVRHKDGSWHWHDDSASPILNKDAEVESVLVFSRNVTAVKQAEEALHMLEALRLSEQKARDLAQEYKKLLEISSEQNSKLKSFTHIISHNIHSHAANLSGLVDLLGETKQEEERRYYTDLLKLSCTRLTTTIQNLNEIISVSERQKEKLKSIKLKNAIEQALDCFRASLDRYQIDTEIVVSESCSVQAIEAYLDSVLFNLISNAIKYRNPKAQNSISFHSEQKGEYIKLCVRDRGLGIDLQRYGDKIFGMYKTFHGNEDARGFGLYISKTQLESMGGSIRVESKVGEGTSFYVYMYGKY